MKKLNAFTFVGATHVETCKNGSKNAFTLAEVLITLGIIGVVAAMTMPTLINQTNGAQYKAAYKKALSAISQGVTLNVALDDQSFADAAADTILKKRMNVVKELTSNIPAPVSGTAVPEGTTVNRALYFNDSSVFVFVSESGCKNETKICKGYIDVNGDKGPNKVVSCDTADSTAFDSTEGNKIASATSDCTVTSPTDIYPVYYYDQTVVPATNAARNVLYGK